MNRLNGLSLAKQKKSGKIAPNLNSLWGPKRLFNAMLTTASVTSWLSRMGLMADPSRRLYLRCSSNRKASKQVTVLSFFRLYRPSHGRLLFPAEIIDLLKGFIIGLSVYVMSYIDTSMMYHLIKSQSVIKLYLFYNMLEASTHYPLLTHLL